MKRLKELLVDYAVIIAYLVLLLIINVVIIFLVLKEIPAYTETQSQLIATFTSVIPIILIFSYLDFKDGSIGKRAAGLKLMYVHKRFSSSLVRNIIKFLPWQLGHVGVIHGMYSGFDMVAIILANGGTLLGVVMLSMGLFRKDKRHLGDFLAGTKVELQ
ncbi:RDD family protein [Sporosarcina sp. ACRSL]|uniref:RDD family protein n=1 Tax=Sporosarcina sp. ACRSL TaxID=2918215 RepID=UPI001EF47215|nr:RDD family protein [Sporosarcina sp. ACRSL]